MLGGSVVGDWDQVVRHLTVSSNENLAYRLIDGNDSTYWQSSGPQGKVSTSNVCLSFPLIHVHVDTMCIHTVHVHVCAPLLVNKCVNSFTCFGMLYMYSAHVHVHVCGMGNI